MNTMRRVRLFFGFFAAFVLVFLCLWLGFQKFIERQIHREATQHGFRVESIESIRPLFMGLNIHRVKLSSPDQLKHLCVENIDFYVSFKSLFYKSLKKLDVRGLQLSGKANIFRELFSSFLTNDVDDSSFIELQHFSGVCFLESPQSGKLPGKEAHEIKSDRQRDMYFIPFDMTITNDMHKRHLDADLRLISSDMTTNAHVHFDKDPHEFSTNVTLNHLNARAAGLGFFAKRILFSTLSSPHLIDAGHGQGIDIMMRGDDISFDFLHSEDKRKSAVHFETKLRAFNNDSLFKLDGQGALLLDDQKAMIKIATLDDDLTVDLEAKNLHAASFLRLLNHFSRQDFGDVQGEASLHVFAKIPMNLSETELKNITESCLLIVMDRLQQNKNKGFVKLDLKDVSIDHKFYGIEKLNSDLQFLLFPFQAQGKQTIQAESAHFSRIHFTKPKLTFTMKDQFKIQEFFSQILGGILRLHSFETNNGNDISIGDVTTFIFDVDHVDLLDALAVMEIDGLSGTGRMGGQGQIKFSRRQGVEVKNAKFFSTSASGEIKYPNLPIPDVGKALENITFTMLSVELVPADGKLQALIEILGHNPNFMNGYPHRFKIKTSGDLQETFASSLSFFR